MAQRDLVGKQTDYQTEIAHLLPSEITAFYISVKGIIPFDGTNQALNTDYLIVSFAFGLLLTFFFYLIMPQLLKVSGRWQRILYLTTFLVWLLGIDIDHVVDLLKIVLPPDGASVARVVINLFVAVWSFSVPFLFRAVTGGIETDHDGAPKDESRLRPAGRAVLAPSSGSKTEG